MNRRMNTLMLHMAQTVATDNNWNNYFFGTILEVFRSLIRNGDFQTSSARSDYMHTLTMLTVAYNPANGSQVVQRELPAPANQQGNIRNDSDHAIVASQNKQDVILPAESDRMYLS